MNVEGFTVTRYRDLIDRDGQVSFHEEDDCWILRPLTPAADMALTAAGINSVSLDLKFRQVIKLAHTAVGSSLNIKYSHDETSAYDVDGLFTLWKNSAGWHLACAAGTLYVNDVTVRNLYQAYARTCAGRLFRTRHEALKTLRESANDNNNFQPFDKSQWTLYPLFAAEDLDIIGIRIWQTQTHWRAEATTPSAEKHLQRCLLKYVNYRLDAKRPQYSTKVFFQMLANIFGRETGDYLCPHVRYGILGTGMSLVQGLDDMHWSEWAFVANGIEWLLDMPHTHQKAFAKIQDLRFASIELALEQLVAIMPQY